MLETEIENAKQSADQQTALAQEMESEGMRLKKQLDTMTSLKEALEI